MQVCRKRELLSPWETLSAKYRSRLTPHTTPLVLHDAALIYRRSKVRSSAGIANVAKYDSAEKRSPNQKKYSLELVN